MMWFVIVILVAVAVLAAYLTRPDSAARTTRGPFEQGAKERDPVCGMNVDVSHAAGRREHGGRIYWFCSTGCQDKFDADPEGYSSKGLAPAMP